MKKEIYQINGKVRKPYCHCFKNLMENFVPGKKYHCIHGFPVCHPDHRKEWDDSRHWKKDQTQDAQ